MVDIAEVGFRADTDELDVANQKMKALKPSAESVEKASENLNKKLNKTNSVFGKLAMGGNTVNSVFGKLAGGVKSLATGLLGIATGVIAGFAFANMIDGARDLSSALAELATLLPANSAELANMQSAARAMADEFGTTAAFQIQAFYGAVSAGATDAAAAIAIVDTANKLAIGGITDVATGVDILTTATNAYAASGLLASSASDALFVGMRAGKTTIGELAGGLGNVIPIAAALGVEFDELVAGTAALTLQGLSTATAITSLRAILSGVAKPTAEASKLATELGLDFSTTALRTKGLAGFLQDVVDKTGGSADKLSVLFGSVEALNAALAFAGAGGESFIQILGDMADKTGATDQALTTVQQNLDNRWGLLLTRLNNLAIDLGYALLSVIVPAGEAVAKTFEFASDNADVLIIALGVLIARQIPALVARFSLLAASLIAAQIQMTAAAVASTVLATAMNLIPFVAVVTGLTLAWRWFTNTGEAANITATAIDAASESSTQLSDTLVNVANGLQQTEEQLRSISQTETLLAQQRYAEEYQQSLITVSDEILNVAEALRLEGVGISENIMADFYDLANAVSRGQKPLDELTSKFDEIGILVPEIAPIVNTFIQAANNAETLGGKVERTNALMRLLNGEATEADRLLLGIATTNISGNIANGANEAARLAGNLNTAYNNMLRLQAQGISSLRESEIRLANRGDAVGTAGALAAEQFDSQFDYSGITSIAAGEEINRQRDAFIANATATEENRQALIAWQKAQAEAASTTSSGGGGSVTSSVTEQKTALEQLAEQYSSMSEPFNQAQQSYSALDDALQNGIINNDQFVSSLQRIQEAFLATGGTAEQWGKIVNGQTDSVAQKMRDLGERTLSNLGDEFIDLAVDGEASFGDLAKSIIKDLLKIAWQTLVVKPILESLGNLGGGSGGGLFSGILGFLGGLFNAKGNAFDPAGVSTFANGGAFSNSVVSGATPFLFGKGGADLGIMGEAGPEAIMPLQRGADGSLGVQMYGGNGGGQPVSNNVEISNVYKIEGAISEDKVVANIRAQGEKTKEDVKQSVVGWLNEYDQNGTM